MKTLLEAALVAGFIIGLHLIAGFIYTYAAWLGILLLAWTLGSLLLIVLRELGMRAYDLPKVRQRASR